jgi:hypothetical protein
MKELSDTDPITPAHLLAVRSDGLSFAACVNQAISCVELVRQVDRLYGTTLVTRTAPIERMVDEATGKQSGDIRTLLRFVWNYIFIRCPKL